MTKKKCKVLKVVPLDKLLAALLTNKYHFVISIMTIEKHPFAFYFYIITNQNKTVLYCGMTNNLDARLKEHESAEGNRKTFTGRYNCHYLLY